jgi:hypothetical protein
MKTLGRLLLFALSAPAFAGVLLDREGETFHPGRGVPFIVLSTTLTVEDGARRHIQGYMLSVLPDGTCHLRSTRDRQQDRSVPPDRRNVKIRNFGPKILPENVRAALQRFFSESLNWTLARHSYVSRGEAKTPEIWLAELTLYFGTDHHTCTLSSVEREYPELSEAGYEFLNLLERIAAWMRRPENADAPSSPESAGS